ncbi:unnamed protein product, partial [marine sediment metagenome]
LRDILCLMQAEACSYAEAINQRVAVKTATEEDDSA